MPVKFTYCTFGEHHNTLTIEFPNYDFLLAWNEQVRQIKNLMLLANNQQDQQKQQALHHYWIKMVKNFSSYWTSEKTPSDIKRTLQSLEQHFQLCDNQQS